MAYVAIQNQSRSGTKREGFRVCLSAFLHIASTQPNQRPTTQTNFSFVCRKSGLAAFAHCTLYCPRTAQSFCPNPGLSVPAVYRINITRYFIILTQQYTLLPAFLPSFQQPSNPFHCPRPCSFDVPSSWILPFLPSAPPSFKGIGSRYGPAKAALHCTQSLPKGKRSYRSLHLLVRSCELSQPDQTIASVLRWTLADRTE